MSLVEDFIYKHQDEQKEILEYFHTLLTTELELSEKLRYKIPFYYGRTWICYLNPTKTGSIELAFVRGNELSNANGLLDFKDRKQVGGISFKSVSEIPKDAVLEILQEAIFLDETTPYTAPFSRK